MAILITGGARSGKSRFAEQYAARLGTYGIYIATCQPYDEEMKERIRMHVRDREASGFRWETKEEPLEAASLLYKLALGFTEESREALAAGKPWTAPPVLLDCITLWLTNRLLQSEAEQDGAARLAEQMEAFIEAVRSYPYPLLLVTNEVGDGIVPEYSLGRRFRDEAGRLNQRLAEICERVFLVTAGIPVELKSIAFRWDEL
ncbi:bifunctional adenosylcobinamide kinase/adenosylcobinamide-phosphate guanylyltransferase [Paenibacillus sp. 1011MAR3C5]|uniref:bifunctional adenosylcobinamide kinase/adenosylcobinamide-phosphate guanylyltransferase n=1 Tax=Paenibacillus sp. 1011MAR3C5 TaxID=1675787 RepID=UPI000E6BE9FB|nr:bifunctional adenosylcobinamide kinase/adenosylcobinamide-phosphate guanylyltransferase [Paenibacillus sp. 1011MAR3C5]RJE86867.1 bifunctional adenosylcobinamide kinase/adenosylcobinamide-phosphate guanylyltransferase [Paenibacillus sp. 1011MAR3C5]